MKNILVLGRNGQIGSAFFDLLEGKGTFLTRNDVDFSAPNTIYDTLNQYTPEAVINCAAYTAVDNAEDEENLATIINGQSVSELARFCYDKDIPLIHYSTDYVFDGNGVAPWEPDDLPAPINAYGRSKLSGEEAIKKIGGKHLIFRTSWVYDAHGKNFFNTMLRLGKDREELRIVDDQVGAPSYAPDIAKATLHALQHANTIDSFPSGIYHLCGKGEVSWYEFAKSIFLYANNYNIEIQVQDLIPVSSSAYPTKAKRPHNSRMNCDLTRSLLKTMMPDWHESLERCFQAKLKTISEKTDTIPPNKLRSFI